MTKEQLEQILIILFEQKKEDDKKQKATYEYFETVFPESYAPIVDSVTCEQLKVLKPILWEDIIDWIKYFLYEAEDFYPNCEIEVDLKKIIISNDADAIRFILSL